MALTFIDDEGFHRARLDERLAALTSAIQAIVGTDKDLSPESVDGQLIGVFAEMISDSDQLAEAVFNGRSAAGARGAALARLALLNGVVKKSAQFSTVPIVLTGTTGTVIPAGSLIASQDDATAVFETTTTMTLVLGTASGTARATSVGPVSVAATRLSVLLTVISGWTGASNPVDATRGSFTETDPALRTRRFASVAIPSQGIVDGLFAALAQLDDVEHVAVYENPEDTVDANGLPPHSINAIVDGGAAADIGNALWLKKSMGVTQVGSHTQDITDTQGIVHTMRWNQPTPVNVYIIVTLDTTVGAGTKTAIKDALVSYGNANAGIGVDVTWSRLFIPINSVPGLNVLSVFLGSAPSPTLQANLAVAFNALAGFDAARISVVP